MAKFIRKHLNPFGTYYAAYKVGTDENGNAKIVKEIKIEGREVFSTDDKKVIEFLRKDEAVVEIDKETVIEPQNDEAGKEK